MRRPGSTVGAAANRRAALDPGLEHLGLVLLASRILVVGERGVGADEDVVADTEAVPELDAALHGDAVADDHVVLDEDMVADVAVAPDRAPREDVREGPDAGAFADCRALAERVWMDEDTCERGRRIRHV